jgi:DNA topoisomerase-1
MPELQQRAESTPHKRPKTRALTRDGAESARSAGLRYVSDSSPGIRRHRAGRGFSYVDSEGRTIRDRHVLRRIRALVIPPAWSDVWICSVANGHIQVSARDARGRKQYRYHARWREVRDENKYERMAAFGEALPALRQRVEADLSQPGLSRNKVLATVVRLLELTLIRVGNEEYARANESYGLTTLRDRHVRVERSRLTFRFRGKSGKAHEVEVTDRRLAAVIKRCQALPGHELFQYLDDDGTAQSIDSTDVNAYLRECMGEEFTAKDFRTWAGSLLALQALRAAASAESASERGRVVIEAIKTIARRLGNTPATCRKHYVHPAVLAAFLSGELTVGADGDDVARHEAALLRLLGTTPRVAS